MNSHLPFTLDHISNVLRLVATRAARGRNTRMKWNVVSWKIELSGWGGGEDDSQGRTSFNYITSRLCANREKIDELAFFSTLTLLPFRCFLLRRFADIRFFCLLCAPLHLSMIFHWSETDCASRWARLSTFSASTRVNSDSAVLGVWLVVNTSRNQWTIWTFDHKIAREIRRKMFRLRFAIVAVCRGKGGGILSSKCEVKQLVLYEMLKRAWWLEEGEVKSRRSSRAERLEWLLRCLLDIPKKKEKRCSKK